MSSLHANIGHYIHTRDYIGQCLDINNVTVSICVVTCPTFSRADTADHRAPLATLPLCHPHLCSSFTPTLQTEPM